MNEDELEFAYPVAETEEEKPFDESSATDKLEELKWKSEENERRRREKRYFSAFKLILGCLVFLLLIYIVDTLMSAVLKSDLSQVTDGIIEIIKTLLFTLSGYLFARKENGD